MYVQHDPSSGTKLDGHPGASVMVRIACDPPWARVLALPDPRVEGALIRALTVVDNVGNDRCYYQTDKKRLPIGLLNRAVVALNALTIGTEIAWEPALAGVFDESPMANGLVLRADQLDALRAAETYRRGIIWGGTGYGKTLVIAGLARNHLAAKVLVLVEKRDLFGQLVRELGELTGEKIGQVQGETWEPNRITVAMDQTLNNRIRGDAGIDWESSAYHLLASSEILILDEIHAHSNPTGMFLTALAKAPVRIGLSGTPFRDRDPLQWIRVEAMTGPILYKMRAGEMADRGLIPESEVWMVPWGSEDVHIVNRDWPECYEDGVVFCQKRNATIATLAKRAIDTGRVPLIVFQRQDHGPVIQKILHGISGITLPCVDGNAGTREREPIWRGLAAGTIKGALSSMIVKQGLNLPAVNVIILASARKANTEIVQVLGRGLRWKPAGADQKFYLLDLVDRHSPILARHTDRRASIWKREGYKVGIGVPAWLA